MSNKKSPYKTPNVRIVELVVTKTLLTATMGATLPGVDEEEMDNEF